MIGSELRMTLVIATLTLWMKHRLNMKEKKLAHIIADKFKSHKRSHFYLCMFWHMS